MIEFWKMKCPAGTELTYFGSNSHQVCLYSATPTNKFDTLTFDKMMSSSLAQALLLGRRDGISRNHCVFKTVEQFATLRYLLSFPL